MADTYSSRSKALVREFEESLELYLKGKGGYPIDEKHRLLGYIYNLEATVKAFQTIAEEVYTFAPERRGGPAMG